MTETYHPEVGGGETQARSLTKGLSTRCLPVCVVTRRSSPDFEKVEQDGPVSVYRVGPVGRQHYKKWGLLLSTLPTLWQLRREYDLIYVSGFRLLGIPAVLSSALLGKRSVLKADSLGEMSGEFFSAGLNMVHLSPRSIVFRPFLAMRNWLLRKADAFVAISSELDRELQDHGVDPDKISVIPNSVDTDRFRPVSPEEKIRLRQQLNLPKEATIIIYTGRLVSYKGLPLLLRVWREIRKDHSDVYLLLVGTGGLDIHNCENELREYVSTHGLDTSVHFAGAVHNVNEYLQAADIFVFPTEREAFGISVIEAMACGLPVIATRVGGVRDIIHHNQDGVLIDTGNSKQLEQALELLFENATYAAKIGVAARKTTVSRYANSHILDAYIDLFNRESFENDIDAK